jgi:hypothetical protein
LDVPGKFEEEHLVTCDTPSFEAIGPRENVEIFISILGGDFTLTCPVSYTYFLNTKAENTLA